MCLCVCESLSRVQLFATPRTVACQASLSMEFSRQEYWSALPFSSPESYEIIYPNISRNVKYQKWLSNLPKMQEIRNGGGFKI